jgi:hypothetical protein
MEKRQVFFFRFGCWVALSIAIALLVGYLIGPTNPSNDLGRSFRALAMEERFLLPGGSDRTLMDFVNGFSLMFCVVVAGVGGLGLIVAHRGSDNDLLMLAVSRVLAITSLLLLGLSLTYFFIVPTLVIALMTCCFAFASVSKT